MNFLITSVVENKHVMKCVAGASHRRFRAASGRQRLSARPDFTLGGQHGRWRRQQGRGRLQGDGVRQGRRQLGTETARRVPCV